MAEHTKGPWNWLNYHDGRKLLTGHNRAVIHCPGPGPAMSVSDEDEALIAIAPEMFDVLSRVAISPCEYDTKVCPELDDDMKCRTCAARAVLGKAKGV